MTPNQEPTKNKCPDCGCEGLHFCVGKNYDPKKSSYRLSKIEEQMKEKQVESVDSIVKKCRNFIKFGMDDEEIYRMRDCLEIFVRESIESERKRADEAEKKYADAICLNYPTTMANSSLRKHVKELESKLAEAEKKLEVYREQEKRWMAQLKVNDVDACNALIDALDIQGKKLAEAEEKIKELTDHIIQYRGQIVQLREIIRKQRDALEFCKKKRSFEGTSRMIMESALRELNLIADNAKTALEIKEKEV